MAYEDFKGFGSNAHWWRRLRAADTLDPYLRIGKSLGMQWTTVATFPDYEGPKTVPWISPTFERPLNSPINITKARELIAEKLWQINTPLAGFIASQDLLPAQYSFDHGFRSEEKGHGYYIPPHKRDSWKKDLVTQPVWDQEQYAEWYNRHDERLIGARQDVQSMFTSRNSVDVDWQRTLNDYIVPKKKIDWDASKKKDAARDDWEEQWWNQNTARCAADLEQRNSSLVSEQASRKKPRGIKQLNYSDESATEYWNRVDAAISRGARQKTPADVNREISDAVRRIHAADSEVSDSEEMEIASLISDDDDEEGHHESHEEPTPPGGAPIDRRQRKSHAKKWTWQDFEGSS